MQIEAFSLEIYFYSLKPRYFRLQEKNYKYMYMLFFARYVVCDKTT